MNTEGSFRSKGAKPKMGQGSAAWWNWQVSTWYCAGKCLLPQKIALYPLACNRGQARYRWCSRNRELHWVLPFCF